MAFDWAYYHYIHLQSSKSDILEGLDLWCATVIKHDSDTHGSTAELEGVPWRNANALYETIDLIQAGNAPWKTYTFSYTGPKPPTPPAWMEETFELNAHDVLLMIEEQIGTPDFDGQVEYVPYQEFDSNGDRIYSNNMSAHFAFHEAVS